ncbi:5dee336a-a4bd-4898-9ebf-9c00f6195ab8 [Thermothielavioides terrestris]
MTNIL